MLKESMIKTPLIPEGNIDGIFVDKEKEFCCLKYPKQYCGDC